MLKTIIYNLDSYEWSDRNGMYLGQAGAKEGIVINGQNWIVKYPKTTKGLDGVLDSYTTAPLSEYIGSRIYEILGYDVHKTILGTRNEKIVVACKDFCPEGVTLREIRALKNIYNKELEEQIERSISSTGSDHSVDLEEILIHLEHNPVLKDIPNIKERFWECAIIDGIINNNDRNNGNWGLLYKDRRYSLAPIYDNGASFSSKMSEEKVKAMATNPERMRASALNTVSSYNWEGKVLPFRNLVKLDNPDMQRALLSVVPKIQQKMEQIKEFLDGIPERHEAFIVCSKERKIFYMESMQLRYEQILLPAYFLAKENNRDFEEEWER